jgi:hypothetical protein
MSWTRIEAMGRGLGLEEGTQACIADPLWMIGRQWQVGELRGDDAARPAAARVTVGTASVDRYRPAETPTMRPLPADMPLERLVESMPVSAGGPAGAFHAAQRGSRLLRKLRRAGLAAAADRLAAEFVFDDPGEPVGFGPAGALAASVVARRGLDGVALAEAPLRRVETALSGLPADEMAAAIGLVDAWRGGQARSPESWVDQRMEYRFSIGAQTDLGPVTLVAHGHPGGPLDWYSFDVDPRPATPPPPGPPGLPVRAAPPGTPTGPADSKVELTETTVTVVPTNARFAGMPASRWWEFEDGGVNFGDLDAGLSDLARLAVADFITTYADDWFVLPVRIATGVLARVLRLEVVDTFGGNTTIDASAVVDRARAPRRPRAFRLFELHADGSAGRAPWLYVPAVFASTLEGEPLERVEFARDEGANLCWAVERLVEGPLGRAVDRARAWLSSQAAAPAAPADPGNAQGDERWEYRVESPTPPWWIPLLPQRIGSSAQTSLRRARMRSWADLDRAVAGAKGVVLRPDRPLRLHEEEVPPTGATVDRRWQFGRSHDGRTHLWLQHRKRPGRGERSSGISWDRLMPTSSPDGPPQRDPAQDGTTKDGPSRNGSTPAPPTTQSSRPRP